MENFMMRRRNPRTIMSHSSPKSPALSIRKDSQTISKPPKIRIIHIFAPEIIKTDAANFRELVQRLTGKPSQEKGVCKRKPGNIAAARRTREPAMPMAKKMELRTGFLPETRERVIKEEELGLWKNNNNGENYSSGGFLSSSSGFGDFDGFIQELCECPFLPLDASHHMHGFDEAQLA